MSSANSSSPPILDLACLFELENPDKFNKVTCLANADSKGRRCQNPIALSNRVAAAKLLKGLSVFEPGEIQESEPLHHRLELAAQYCLCRNVHWHRVDKFEEVVDKWKDILEREQEQLDQRTEDEEGEDSLQADTDSDSESESDADSQSDSDSDSGYESTLSENDSSPSTPLDSIPQTPTIDSSISLSDLPSPPSTPPNQRDEDSSPEGSEDIEENNTPPATPPRFQWPPSSDTPFSWSPSNPPSTVSTARTTLELPNNSVFAFTLLSIPSPSSSLLETDQLPSPCTQTHVIRRAVDDDCPICTTAMASTPLEELVWCKESCGRSVHKTCFEQWESYRGDDATCVYCRAVWTDPCAHDAKPPAIS